MVRGKVRMSSFLETCQIPKRNQLWTLLALLSLLLCLPVIASAAGGDYIWSPYNVPLADKQQAKASAFDSQGNVILVGATGAVSSDFHVVKVKADGSGPLWSVSKDSTGGNDVATAVTVDGNDDVIVTGHLWNGSSFNDIYTAKYAAADGALIWEHTYDGTGGGNDYATAITVDDVGTVYVGGYMQAVATTDDTILLKYHPSEGPKADGTPYWAYSYDGGTDDHDRIYAIAVTSAGAAVKGVAVTGEKQSAGGDFDCLTLRYNENNTSGTPDQVWTYSDANDGRGQALAMDQAGNVVMAGYIHDSGNQDFYVVEYPAAGGAANWVAPLYDSGQDDHANAIWLDSADNVYVVGDDATLTTGSDIHAAKYDGATGAEVWSDSYNTSGGHNDMSKQIIGDNAGELFVVGYKNDGLGGLDDFLTLKLKKDDGALLWSKEYDGAAKNDRAVGVGLCPSGDLLVAGWSDRWTSGSTDYDFQVLKYESGALNPPTSLAAVVATNTQIDLSWSDNSTGEDKFVLERRIGESGTPTYIDITADATSYSDSGLTADTRYYYRLKAYSAATGDSPYSNEVNAKTTVISYDPPSRQFQYGAAAAGDDFAQAIAVGPDNHPVVTGYITGGVTDYDYYTIKLDRADLSEQWNADYNDEFNEGDVANSLTVDSNNRVTVTGYSSLYGGGAGNTNDVYTIGYPADGSTESWTDQYNGPDGDDDRSSAVASAVDGSDNVVVVGYGKNNSVPENDDIYVIKFQPDGTRDWAIVPYDGGYEDSPAAVAFDQSNNILVGGYSYNATDKDFLVAKYDGTDGSQLWLKKIDGSGNGNDYVNDLVVDSSGDVYVTGYSYTTSNTGDMHTIKFAGSDGTPLWEKSYNGSGNGYDVGEGIAFDPVDGSIIVGGTTYTDNGDQEYFHTRYDTDGTLRAGWPKILDRPGSHEAMYEMSIDQSGTVALTGTTDAGGNDDILTVKYDSGGLILGASVYNGAANAADVPAAVVTNNYGETFVAGITTTAGGDADYVVFLADGENMQSPTPFTAVQLYNQADLSWADNSLDESGFRLEIKNGSCDSTDPWTHLYTAAAGETSYSNTGLNKNTTYCYRIRSEHANGDSSRWAELEVTTADPIAPSGLSTTVLSSTEVQLDWTDNTGNEEHFIIERCEGVGCSLSTDLVEESGTTKLYPVADATTFVDDTVCPGTTYSYQIRSERTNEWITGWSNQEIDVVVDSTIAPTDLNLTLVSEQQVDLGWTDNSSDETGFRVERCITSDCSDVSDPVTAGTVLADDPMTLSDTGLSHSTPYYYRVTPYKTATCNVPAYTPIETITTTPPAPASLSAVSVTSTQINLTWVDGTVSEQGFKIERCQGTSCDPIEIAAVGVDMTRYVDDTVCSGLDYRYRVRAFNGVLWESASGIVDVTAATPLTPGGFAVTKVSEEGIKIDWNMTGYDLNGYLLERCEGGSCTVMTDTTDMKSGRVLALPMEEASWDHTAGDVKDSSGYGNDATSYGSASVTSDGKIGWAGDFNGASDYLATSVTVDQTSSGPGATFEAWVYPNDTASTWRHIISTENGGNDWAIASHGTAWRIYHGSSYWTVGTITAQAWQHLMAVFEPGVGIRFYVNGTKYSTGTINYDTSSNPVHIGRRANGSYFFNGKIDEVMVYNRALSDAEAVARYNGGNTAAGVLTGQLIETGLTPDATYGYQLKSYSSNDCTGSDKVESAPTTITYATTDVPVAPSAFTATVISSTQVNLAWTDNTDSESGFILKRCPGSGTDCDEEAEFVTAIDTPVADSVSYSDTSVCPGQPYTYWLAADNPAGAPNWPTPGAISNSVTTQTFDTPADFNATGVTEVQVDLTWTDDLSDEESYIIEKCSDTLANCTTGDVDANFSPLVTFGHRQVLSEANLWFKMNEASWGSVINSGAGGNGTRYGNAAPVTDAERGKVGQFDGNGDYIRVTNYSGINPTAAITVATWAKSNGATWSADHSLLSKRNAYILSPQFGGTGMRFYIYSSSNWRVIDVPNIPIDITEWHHYAGVYDGSNIILYVDGAEVGRTPWTGTINYETGYLEIGRDDGYTTRYFNGWLDDAMVFNRALTPDEAASLPLNTGNTIYHDQGLIPATFYSYRLRSQKSATCSLPADDWVYASDDTLDPPPPTDLSVNATSTTTIDISWTDNSGSETNYHLQRCISPDLDCGVLTNFSTLDDTLAADTSSYSDNVCPGKTYYYRVRAEKTGADAWPTPTAWDGPVSDATANHQAPSGLVASRVSEAQISLVWNDNTSDESGFELDRCSVSDCSSVETTVALAAGATSYLDDYLLPDATYYYRVRAIKAGACTDPPTGWPTDNSGIANATTSTDLSVPSSLTATMVNSTQIDLSWVDNAVTETGTVIERCTGATCAEEPFAPLDEVAGNVANYSDISVCAGKTYRYRVQAKNEGLSGGGSWTRKMPLSFTGFVADAVTSVTIPHDPDLGDMRDDFGDIRFYDEDNKRELPYVIASLNEGVSATFHVKLGQSNNVSVYYGNPSATEVGNEDGLLMFRDTFRGATIDTNKWVEIDNASNTIRQNDDLQLFDVTSGWNYALISNMTFDRLAGRELYIDLTIPADTAGANYFMVGWELDQTGVASYSQLVHGMYWNNYTFSTYEKNVHRGGTGSYAASTDYEMKITLLSNGASFYIKGGAYADWTLVKTNTFNSDATMRIAFTQNSHQAYIHEVKVKDVAIDTGAALGGEITSGGFAFGNTWDNDNVYSNEAEDSTPSPVAPSGLSVVAVSDSQFELSWTDNNDAEDGFEIERCSGGGCSFVALVPTVGTDVTSYTDTTAPASTLSTYQVRTFKNSICSWPSNLYSGTASDTSFPAPSSALNLSTINSQMIQLDWLDDASDEDGYEVEVQIATGDFVKIADLPADSTGFVDRRVVEGNTDYTYRIRPYRVDIPDTVYSPYSTQESVTTPDYGASAQPDTTCYP